MIKTTLMAREENSASTCLKNEVRVLIKKKKEVRVNILKIQMIETTVMSSAL